MHSFTFWMICSPLVVAAVIYPLWSRWIAGAMVSAFSAILFWLVWVWPANEFWVLGYRLSRIEPWNPSGLSFSISSARTWLLVAYGVLFSVGVLALFFRSYRRILVWSLVWLASLSALWGSLELRQMFFMLSATAAVASIGLAGGLHARGSWRAMLFPAFSYPLTIVATWYVSRASLNPGDPHPFAYASALVGAALFPSLMIFPFHGAFPAIGEESSPPAGFVWFLLWPVAVWSVLIKVHQNVAWWQALPWASWLELSLVGTLLLVVFAGFWQRSPGRVLGYAVLATWALFLQRGAFGIGGFLLRGSGVGLSALGLVLLKELPTAVPPGWRRWHVAAGAGMYMAGMVLLVAGIVQFGEILKAYSLLIYAAAVSVFIGAALTSIAELWPSGFRDCGREFGRLFSQLRSAGR